MKVKEKTIEEKYLSLSELDHVIMRSGMYIGSVKEEQKNTALHKQQGDIFTACNHFLVLEN